MTNTQYHSLQRVLNLAFKRASKGKGKERHGEETPFDKQPILEIQRSEGAGFVTGQILKKTKELKKLEGGARLREILDIIVYAAANYIYEEENCKEDIELAEALKEYNNES